MGKIQLVSLHEGVLSFSALETAQKTEYVWTLTLLMFLRLFSSKKGPISTVWPYADCALNLVPAFRMPLDTGRALRES